MRPGDQLEKGGQQAWVTVYSCIFLGDTEHSRKGLGVARGSYFIFSAFEGPGRWVWAQGSDLGFLGGQVFEGMGET